jgi:hypothetical protein
MRLFKSLYVCGSLSVFFLNPVTSFAQEPDSSNVIPDSTREQVSNVSVSFDVLEDQAQSQDISGLLQSSRDVFVSIAGFNFSAVRYRMRGYDSENFSVFIHGVPMNDAETGWPIYAMWGGLNDVTRYPETRTGISSSQAGFGGVGGYSNMNLRPSMDRPGVNASYAYTNRSYRHRAMATYSSGMKNGWAYTVSMSRRWAKEGYVEGTYMDALSYFAAVERKINQKHSITFIGFGAPTVQGRQGLAVQEAYDLTGNPYYNPFWGYQNGEKRNARVRNNHKPHFLLTHDWKKSKETSVSTTAYFIKGRTGNTNLNWYDAADPRPDYYKNLPSYYQLDNPDEAALITARWENNNPEHTQLDFDQFYFANSKNMYALPDGSGNANRSKYIIEEYRIDPTQLGISSLMNHIINEHMVLSAGFNAEYYKSRNYKVMEDLLGGDFWLDVDQFAEQQFEDPNAAQNNLENPNSIIKQGDEFGYNYDIVSTKANAFSQVEFKYGKIDGYVGLDLSYTSFYRDGKYKNGRFPDNSFGKSDAQTFFNYGVKGGAVYKITGRHFLTANAMYLTRAPFAVNAFIAPRVRDHVVAGLESNKIASADLNYIARFTNLQARVTGYYTKISDQTWSRSYYHDEYRSFVNYIMTGLDEIHLGTEIGISYTIATVLTLQAGAGIGDFIYSSRPTATITSDNEAETLAEGRTVYLTNYKAGGGPQTVASFGLRYNSPKYWFIGASFNYFADNYMEANPDRRTEEASDGLITTDPQFSDLIVQEKLDNGYTIDAYVGYSYMIKRGKFIRFNLSASNILNEKDVHTGGFEQLRYDPRNVDKFPPKYSNMFGTTIFAMISFQF